SRRESGSSTHKRTGEGVCGIAVIVSPAIKLSTGRLLASAPNMHPRYHSCSERAADSRLHVERRRKSSEEICTPIVSPIGDATSGKCHHPDSEDAMVPFGDPPRRVSRFTTKIRRGRRNNAGYQRW